MNTQQSELEPGEVREALEVEKAAVLGRGSECVVAVGDKERTPVDEHLVRMTTFLQHRSPTTFGLPPRVLIVVFTRLR